MDLTVDGYIGALIEKGNPPEAALRLAEAELRVEYADAMGDHEYRMYCNLVKEITISELTIVQVQELVKSLENAYVPQFVAALNRLLPASNLVLDPNNPEKYERSLQRALNRSKSIKLSIEIKKQKLKAIEAKYDKGDKPGSVTREYYYGVLLTLSADCGYRMTDEITVWEFCESIKRYNRKTESYGRR